MTKIQIELLIKDLTIRALKHQLEASHQSESSAYEAHLIEGKSDGLLEAIEIIKKHAEGSTECSG